MIYCKIENGVVSDRAQFDTEMPDDWPERSSWIQNDEAQIGWTYDGTFHAPPPQPIPPLTPQQVRRQTFEADQERQDLVTRLQSATPAEIKTYVQSNVTDLTSAKILIAKILLVLSAP